MASTDSYRQQFSGAGISISPRPRQGPMLSPHGQPRMPRSPASPRDDQSIRSNNFDSPSPPTSAFSSPAFASSTFASPTHEMHLIPHRSPSPVKSRSRSRHGNRSGASPHPETRYPTEAVGDPRGRKSFAQRMKALCGCFGSSSSSPRASRTPVEVEKIEPVHWSEM